MRQFRHFLPALLLTLCAVQFANAQSLIDVNVGFGAAMDKAATTGLDQNTFLSCMTPGSATCSQTPSLNSFMLGIGGNFMLWKHFGVGMEANIQPVKKDYALLQAAIPTVGQAQITLQSRVTFYDFNGIYQPITTKRAALQLIGGIGGANLKFYQAATGANAIIGSFNQSQYAGSSNHFQMHAGVGVQVYVTDKVFVRPQFDIRYVPNFTQFGRNVVTQASVWLGYTFGDRQ